VNLHLNPNVTTIMSEHGNIRSYLHRLKIIENPECPCKEDTQTVDHDGPYWPEICRRTFVKLKFLQDCIYSVEIPKRFSFVIEFIIPKFFEGSTCFERHTAHRQEL